MKVNFFNFFYFFYIALFVIILLTLYYVFRNKSKKTQKYLIAGILFFSLTIHFTKLLFYPYNTNMPYSIKKITFENICAVSTLIFPFIFLFGNNKWKDYMFYIGILSGFLALVIPTEALGKNVLTYDLNRFYICHMIIFIAPFLMVKFGFHELSLKRLYNFPICFITVLCLILVNEVILIESNLVEVTKDTYFDIVNRNSSFIFGPKPEFASAIKYLTWVNPRFIMPVNNNVTTYIPIVWLIIPVFVFFPLFEFFIYLAFNPHYFKIKKQLKLEAKENAIN